MPWKFTAPINAGDLDPVGSYGEVKIVMQQHRSNQGLITLILSYGNTVAGKWKSGVQPVGLDTNYTISDAEYETVVADSIPDVQTSDPNDAVTYAQVGAVWIERTYFAVKRGLYEHLVAQSIIGAGSLE